MTSGVTGVEADEAGADQVAVLSDVKAGDKVVIANVAFRWRVPSFGDLTKIFFEVGDDVLEAGDLRSVLRGAGLNGEGKAVDDLAQLLGRDVGMGIEGGEY